MTRHPAFPNEDEFLICLIEREMQLMRRAKDFDVFSERATDLYLSSNKDLILDYIGIPPDDSSWKSQKELCEGKCKHGVDFFCRDWLLGWFMGDKEARKEIPTARLLLAELRVTAKEWPTSRYRCPRCEAGDLDFDRELQEMMALHEADLEATASTEPPREIG